MQTNGDDEYGDEALLMRTRIPRDKDGVCRIIANTNTGGKKVQKRRLLFSCVLPISIFSQNSSRKGRALKTLGCSLRRREEKRHSRASLETEKIQC
jgi:hypothetical protein